MFTEDEVMLALDILKAAFAPPEQYPTSVLSDQQKAELLDRIMVMCNRRFETEAARQLLSPDLDAVIRAWAGHTFGEL